MERHPDTVQTIRPAVQEDTPGLILLLREIMAHHGVAPPPETDLRRTLEQVFASSGHEFLVAVKDGEVVGTCALLYSLSTWSAGVVCELQDVVVAAAHRGAGVGSALIAAAEDRARARGCRRLYLTAETPNLTGHAFYRSLGLAEKAVLYFERALEAGHAAGADPPAGAKPTAAADPTAGAGPAPGADPGAGGPAPEPTVP